jgi:Zn-dependent peptidase ImmA (M78 family)
MDKGQSSICVTLTRGEREKLYEIERNWKIPPEALLYRLIRYILDGKMDFERLLKEHNKLGEQGEANEAGGAACPKTTLRVTLEAELKERLRELGRGWLCPPSVVVKCLVRLYIFEKIGKGDIWY